MSTPPQRDARTVLFTGLLLLVPLAALWLLLNPVHGSRQGGGAGPWEARTDGAVGAGDARLVPAPPAWPPPRMAGGASRQAEWTLLAVTVAPWNGGGQTPPALLAPLPGGQEPRPVARNPFLQFSPGAVGLWIGVRGGMGVKTLDIPQDGRRHAYPFGRFTLVSQPQLSPTGRFGGGRFGGSRFGGERFGGKSDGGFGGTVVSNGVAGTSTLQWETAGGPDSPGLAAHSPVPYQIETSFLAVPGRPATETVTLTPTPFSSRFRVTALPLAADGRPTGGAVALLCQPVTADALLAQIPAGYNAATRQFRVTVARAGGEPKAGVSKGGEPKGGSASWLVTGLPPATEDRAGDVLGGGRPAASARVGPFRLRAVAAEAEDRSGWPDLTNPRPPGGGGPTPANEDGHQRTGLPTLDFRLFARAVQPMPPDQAWLFQLDRVTPQWGATPPPPLPPAGAAGVPVSSGMFPLSPGMFPLSSTAFRPDVPEWLLREGSVGAAWPGQQKWVTLAGTALRQAIRTETVTFHDAEVVHDADFGGDRIVWRHPETETTPSGIAVTVLNGSPGRRGVPAFGQGFGGSYAPGSGQNSQGLGGGWWYDRGNAELLLAWRLPPGLRTGLRAAPNEPRVAVPGDRDGKPRPGMLSVSWDDMRPDPYPGAAAPPGGARDARALMRAGYTPLRLSVWAAQTPKRTPAPLPSSPSSLSPFPAARPGPPAALPPYSWRDGPFVVTATPLPRRLAAITLRITLREEQERRPVILRVPVAAGGVSAGGVKTPGREASFGRGK